MTVTCKFAWYDFWIGLFWNRRAKALYICPVPMFAIRISWRREP